MSQLKRNTDLEVLRAIAITYTLATHLVWPALPKLGSVGRVIQSHVQFWTGVDLFFAISGFIITASLLRAFADRRRQAGAGRRDFLAVVIPFWVRRAFRLLPSAWLWLAVTLGLAAGFNAGNSFGSFSRNAHEALASVLEAANFYFYSWFARGHQTAGSLGAYWSLSLEEQFYVVLPFLLFLIRRSRLTALLLAACALQLFIPRPIGFSTENANLAWFVRTDALILGVLIAFGWERGTWRSAGHWIAGRLALVRGAVGMAVLGLALLPAIPAVAFCSTGLVAILSGFLVLLASFDEDYISPAGRMKDALVWLGSRSYSIYLIHIDAWAVVVEVKKRIGIPEGGAFAVVLSLIAVALTLGIAELNFRFVETPFRQIGRRLADRLERRRAAVQVGYQAVLE